MAGNRASENGDFVTPRAAYRTLSVADTGGPTDAGIPVINTRLYEVTPGGSELGSYYGRNAQINVAAILEGLSSATLQLWLKAVIEKQVLIDSEASSSSSSSAGPASEWVKVGSDTVLTVSGLVTYKDIPPGEYKVVVTALAGGGDLYLREQHAA